MFITFNFFFYSRYHPRETKHNHGDDLIVEVNRYVSYIFLSAMEYTYSEDRCLTRVRTPEFSGSGLPSYYFPVGGITLRYVRIAVYKMLICFESKASSGQQYIIRSKENKNYILLKVVY